MQFLFLLQRHVIVAKSIIDNYKKTFYITDLNKKYVYVLYTYTAVCMLTVCMYVDTVLDTNIDMAQSFALT